MTLKHLMLQLDARKSLPYRYLFVLDHFDAFYDCKKEIMRHKDWSTRIEFESFRLFDRRTTVRKDFEDSWLDRNADPGRVNEKDSALCNPLVGLSTFDRPALNDWWVNARSISSFKDEEFYNRATDVSTYTEDYRRILNRFLAFTQVYASVPGHAGALNIDQYLNILQVWWLIINANSQWYRSNLQHSEDLIAKAWSSTPKKIQLDLTSKIELTLKDPFLHHAWWLTEDERKDLQRENQKTKSELSISELRQSQNEWNIAYQLSNPLHLEIGDLTTGRAIAWILKYPDRAEQWSKNWTEEDLDLMFYEEIYNVQRTVELPDTQSALKILEKGLAKNQHAAALLVTYGLIQQHETTELWRDYRVLGLLFPSLSQKLRHANSFAESIPIFAEFFECDPLTLQALDATMSLWKQNTQSATTEYEGDPNVTYVRSMLFSEPKALMPNAIACLATSI